MIQYVVPWRTGDIGGAINDAIAQGREPWVCVRDGDTLLLDQRWGERIESVVRDNDDYDLIGCMTNRLRAPYQLHEGQLSDNGDISHHLRIANARAEQWGTTVAPLPAGPIAGMFMLFRREVWQRRHFQEQSIYFDSVFTDGVRRSGGRVGIALGLYVFHLYRWGVPDPANNWSHLTCPSLP